ncbi:hypothetical protein [Mesorhizobium sp.]|uniref:hypothetical protein n=1 Tax=Mesorhizobium sp. TaxID=1871066 RepID=UPI0012248FC3|nr:hypothetical protein [Mesorhizobium sp.]TIS87698.1 MAG: hypothetical protein E5W89_23995 [Mesorhizobium sp.]
MKPLDPALAQGREPSYLFGRHDRLQIDGESYRVERKVRDTHVLQRVIGDLIVEDFYVTKTDAEIRALLKKRRARHQENYYTKTIQILKVQHDDSDLSRLREDELRTVAWKKEWVVRFLMAATDVDAAWRPKRKEKDFERFISENVEVMDEWYRKTFGERRRQGRNLAGRVRKACDYPGPTALRNWVRKYIKKDCKLGALKPLYLNSGNRNQLDPRVVAVIEAEVKNFASRLQPKIADICENVEVKLDDLHRLTNGGTKLTVSNNAIRRRIRKIDPLMHDAGRYGRDYALRKYTPVGKGIEALVALGRVEIDSWSVDLHTLVARSEVWKAMSSEERRQVPRIRITLTIAIDCASRCIVGFSFSHNAPSTATGRAALKTMLYDKTELARACGAKAAWRMCGRARDVATDAGPEFSDDFVVAANQVHMNHLTPDADPRKRGIIEKFFATLERVCRYFAGRTFSNVVAKGEYDSEEAAAVTVGEFFEFVVQFIVDKYHMRPHRGLGGRTPYHKWMELTEVADPPVLSDDQIALAFMIRRPPKKISSMGLELLGNAYNSQELVNLRTVAGQREIEVGIEPEDMSVMYAVIPEDLMGRVNGVPDDQQLLIVPTQSGVPKDKTLADVLLGNREVREFLKREAAMGRDIRIDAHRRFLRVAEEVRKRAGMESHEVTRAVLDILEKIMERGGRAAMGSINHAAEQSEDHEIGRVIGKTKKTRPDPTPTDPTDAKVAEIKKRRSRSMNTYDGDDDE